MKLNEMEKKLLFQVKGDDQGKVLYELYMTVRCSNNSERREAAESLIPKLNVLSDAKCMDLVKDIQKNTVCHIRPVPLGNGPPRPDSNPVWRN